MNMRSMSVSQFKATCLARFEEIANGGEAIVITKRGVPIAQVGPVAGEPRARRELGRLAGTMRVRGDVVSATTSFGADADPDRALLDEWAELHR